jgi:predicted dienelactone hydrolase
MVPGGSGALRTIGVPTMVIGSEHDAVVGYHESEVAYAKLAGPRYLVELLAANHLSVVDDCDRRARNANLCVPTDISQEDAHRLVLNYAVPFFRRYLLSKKRAVIRAPTRRSRRRSTASC